MKAVVEVGDEHKLHLFKNNIFKKIYEPKQGGVDREIEYFIL